MHRLTDKVTCVYADVRRSLVRVEVPEELGRSLPFGTLQGVELKSRIGFEIYGGNPSVNCFSIAEGIAERLDADSFRIIAGPFFFLLFVPSFVDVYRRFFILLAVFILRSAGKGCDCCGCSKQ